MVTARSVAEQVRDPELPMLTLADLGVLRDVSESDGRVVVSLTPTYSGCPAMDEMRADVVRALHRAGFAEVEVRTVLHPPWTSDWISERGRNRLTEAGIAPPQHVVSGGAGTAVPLTLEPPRRVVPCPRCGSRDTVSLSAFGSTACRSLRRCRACEEPFEHVKEF
ncbi:1,2-phenylacetyl-CoA epoxidase subunit PaaD [Saccharomonospora piscinae]|uniref:Phenylacetate-CoA oxygenase subunit PaaJ n=1 Tax=Saccharomonospora piscinae TaxID=687388 RepID=A0A1V9A6U9_SACPI|nr:1,2-phenylacetyl-CoA epoxidase subunit PaaD [Saccharomonospora piscinae]OQO92778.1 phenylacetate-CoA oxygenase subunit PaaJ [Saccharomonospora piscinae]TLW92915.1 phenylacetate-CoA oxygenase subunit PaaJ [Saccharomonospora piscinae]